MVSTACIHGGCGRGRVVVRSCRPRSNGACLPSRSPKRPGGAQRLAAYAQRLWRLRVAASTVQRLLRRHGLTTRRQRLLVLEHHSARDAGLLTQRTRQLLWRLRHGQTRHVEAELPGELLCLGLRGTAAADDSH